MIDSQPSVLAIIPARGGSKGLPGKNIRPFHGHPLIVWTVNAALRAECVSRTIVSTDDPHIAEIAEAAGADIPFLRPSNLATDTASSADVVRHAIKNCPGYDYFVLLQPTSPMRTAEDIDGAFTQMQTAQTDYCVSVTKSDESPWLMYSRGQNGRISSILPPWKGGMQRQELPSVYVLNGALYFVKTQMFEQHGRFVSNDAVGYKMPQSHSIDIDTLTDFETVEGYMKTYLKVD